LECEVLRGSEIWFSIIGWWLKAHALGLFFTNERNYLYISGLGENSLILIRFGPAFLE
jgi:hypothetical protein